MDAGEWEELAVKHGIENDKLKKVNKELLSALEGYLAANGGGKKKCGHDFVCVCAEDLAKEAITNAKQVMGDKG